MSKKRLVAVAILVIAVTATVGIYVHDNPPRITPIADVNSGKTTIGENVTIRGEIIYIIMFFMGPNDQVITVGDSLNNVTFAWFTSRIYLDWVIIARGTVYSNHELIHVEWLEHVWLFA